MEKIVMYAKKFSIVIMVITLIITSTSAGIVAGADEGYSVIVDENSITCTYDGEMQCDVFLFIKCNDDLYEVVDGDTTATLYYFDDMGAGAVYTGVYNDVYYLNGAVGTANKAYNVIVDGKCYSVSATGSANVFTGVYSGKYYNAGELGTASKVYYKVYANKLYKIETSGSASVYKKDSSKAGTYCQLVDSECYSVSYKTGDVTKFTGVYSGKYYKAGALGTASKVYYKVYSNKLYKVNTNGSASVYKKDTKKSGTYSMAVDGIRYNVSYKTGAATKLTGTYKGKFYKAGKLTNGWQTLNKKTYYCNSGVPVKGIKKINGKTYYFDSKGVKYTGTGWKTVSKKKYYFKKGVACTGWNIIGRVMYHFNTSGVLSVNKTVDGIKVNKNGKATGPKKAYVLRYAKVLAKDITKESNTKEQNLRICFDYVIKTYKSNGNPRIPHYTKNDWIYVYAYDMYGDRGGGNCFSYAAAFAFLAKQCGYEEVYGCNSGGHGWVEIDGKVYDPEQYKDVGKKIYGWSYNTKGITNYKPAIADYDKNPWKRVKIPG